MLEKGCCFVISSVHIIYDHKIDFLYHGSKFTKTYFELKTVGIIDQQSAGLLA